MALAKFLGQKLDPAISFLYFEQTRPQKNHHYMNLRIFLTTSSLVLIGWLATSYFSEVPLDYLSDGGNLPAQPKVVLSSSDQNLVTAVSGE